MPITTQGLDKAIFGMMKIASGRFLEKPAKKYALRVRSKIKPYPFYKEPHWYRSGYLGKKWYANDSTKEVEFGNPMPYAGWVQDKRQTWFHRRTGWTTIEDVTEKEYEYLKDEIQKALEGLF